MSRSDRGPNIHINMGYIWDRSQILSAQDDPISLSLLQLSSRIRFHSASYNFQVFCIINKISIQIGFAAADAITGLKLIEEGVPKEHLAMMAVPMVPIDIILPIIITRYSSSSRPLDILLKGMPFRFELPNHSSSSPFFHESMVDKDWRKR